MEIDNTLYSPSAHADSTHSNGFFLASDTSAPADAFPIMNADHMTAANLQPGSTYSFTAPNGDQEFGTLVTNIVPYTPPPPPPLSCTPLQFKLALVEQNLYATVLAAVNANPDIRAQIAWAEAQIYIETDPFVTEIATALGQSAAQVHALFLLAQTLSP